MVAVGWNISPAHAAGLSQALFFAMGLNISPAHAAGLSLALWLGPYRPSLVHFIFMFFCVCLYIYRHTLFFEIVIFPRIFLRHFH